MESWGEGSKKNHLSSAPGKGPHVDRWLELSRGLQGAAPRKGGF